MHQRLVHVVRALQRSPHGHAVGGIRHRDHALIFDVELFLRAGPVFALDDDVGLRPGGVHVAFLHVVRLEYVVLAPDDCAFRERILDRENRGQRFDVDLHRAPRFLQQILVRMRQQDDRFFGMVDEFGGEAGLIVHDQRDFVLAGNVGGRDDREFVPGNAVAVANAADAPARDAAAHGHAVDHVRKGEVVHVLGAAGDFFAPLFPQDGMSKEFFFHILPRMSSARPPRRTSVLRTFRKSRQPIPIFNIECDRLFASIRETVRAPPRASSARTESPLGSAGASILHR